MKINGTNSVNFNPYKQQIQKQQEVKRDMKVQDQIEISSQAKKLQGNEAISEKRAALVEELKQAVDAGTYKVNPEETAGKMMDFWSK